MLTALAPDEQISTAHRAKRAYIYVRQSSVNQMKHHRESTELQYRLVDRAVICGRPPLASTFLTFQTIWSAAVICPACWRGAYFRWP
jgi:hypothetical protein